MYNALYFLYIFVLYSDLTFSFNAGALLGNSMAPRESCEGKDAHLVNLTTGTGGAKAGQRTEQCKLTQDSLLHLLDGIILLYHIGAHKQLGKVAAQRDAMNENIAHVQEIDKKMTYCQEKVREDLRNNKKEYHNEQCTLQVLFDTCGGELITCYRSA